MEDDPESRRKRAALRKPQSGNTSGATGPPPGEVNELGELYDRGQMEEARLRAGSLASRFPETSLVWKFIGVIDHRLGRLEQAVENYSNALRLQPDCADACHNLGLALAELGHPAEAVNSFRNALNLRPDFAEAHDSLGNLLTGVGLPEKAVACHERALQLRPDFPDAHYHLGNALARLGRHDAAVSSYQQSLRLRPEDPEAHNNLGAALIALARPEEAVDCFRAALRLWPDYPEAHNNLGNALSQAGRPADALGSYAEALRLRPGFPEALNNRGNALISLGAMKEASASLEEALQLRPDYAEAHRNLSALKKYQHDDAQLKHMLNLMESPGLSEQDQVHLSFALGKACADLEDYDRAFVFFSRGNRLHKAALGYRSSPVRLHFSRIKQAFSGAAGASWPVAAEADAAGGKLPIFVVGMPRSGTTLVEQILSSHSLVHGAGELALLGQAVNSFEWGPAAITPDQMRFVRGSYLGGIARMGTLRRFVTDKMPFNFKWVGFIAGALPEATIIHVKRDARATCWSNFRTYFASGANGFAYDLKDVADYYRMYADLMDFWRERFPGLVYDVVYENLVEDQIAETRRLLAHIGLEWEDQCLEFHKNRRAVQTASFMQVRRSLYKGSSQDWRNYEKHLGPMLEALRDL